MPHVRPSVRGPKTMGVARQTLLLDRLTAQTLNLAFTIRPSASYVILYRPLNSDLSKLEFSEVESTQPAVSPAEPALSMSKGKAQPGDADE